MRRVSGDGFGSSSNDESSMKHDAGTPRFPPFLLPNGRSRCSVRGPAGPPHHGSHFARSRPVTMLPIPFELLSCSWPRPVEIRDERWVSEPEWDAPPSPFRPQPHWRMIEGEPAWTLDWCRLFRGSFIHLVGSQMRRFHVVFRIRAAETGTLVFWDDDGSIVRLGGRVVHEDRTLHPLRRSEVRVQAGDVLEVAHFQGEGEFTWAARTFAQPAADAEAVLAPWRDAVRDRVLRGNGPPLKFYTDGRNPLRAAVAVYSLVLNGFAPSSVLLYGSNQWKPAAVALLQAALPFAEVVSPTRVVNSLRTLGGPGLAELAQRHWFVMKACVALLDGPTEFCLLDDDFFVLDRVDEALDAFRTHDLVYAPDAEHGAEYLLKWGAALRERKPSPAGRFNAGLYWCRLAHDRKQLAMMMRRVRPGSHEPYMWEQGFIATVYAHRPTLALASERYLFPLFDGLPGGTLGYDYAGNPCGLTSVHFGGLGDKPRDDAMLYLAPQILARRTARPVDEALPLAG